MTKETTTTVEVRIDYRLLATLVRFYLNDASRPMPTTKGGVLSQACKDLIQLLINHKLVDQVESYEEAVNILMACGLGISTRRGHVPSSLLNQLRLESLQKETPATIQQQVLEAVSKTKETEDERDIPVQ